MNAGKIMRKHVVLNEHAYQRLCLVQKKLFALQGFMPKKSQTVTFLCHQFLKPDFAMPGTVPETAYGTVCIPEVPTPELLGAMADATAASDGSPLEMARRYSAIVECVKRAGGNKLCPENES